MNNTVVPCPCSRGKPPLPDMAKTVNSGSDMDFLKPCAGPDGVGCKFKQCRGLFWNRMEEREAAEGKKPCVPPEYNSDESPRPTKRSKLDEEIDPSKKYKTMHIETPAFQFDFKAGPKKPKKKDRWMATGNVELIEDELKVIKDMITEVFEILCKKEEPPEPPSALEELKKEMGCEEVIRDFFEGLAKSGKEVLLSDNADDRQGSKSKLKDVKKEEQCNKMSLCGSSKTKKGKK